MKSGLTLQREDGQCNAVQCSAVQCSAVVHSLGQVMPCMHCKLKCCAVHCISVQCIVVKCIAVQCSEESVMSEIHQPN